MKKVVVQVSLCLPVAAYVFGAKDSFEPSIPFYDGSGMISQSGNDVIFVAMNYRVGAYGFLAGTTMEEQGNRFISFQK